MTKLTPEQQAVLAKQADAELERQADAAKRQQIALAEQEAEAKRRADLESQEADLARQHAEALMRAEIAARELVEHIGTALDIGDQRAAILNTLSEPVPDHINGHAACRMLSEKLAAVLSTLATRPGATPSRFGRLKLERSGRQPGEPWIEARRGQAFKPPAYAETDLDRRSHMSSNRGKEVEAPVWEN